RSRRPSPANLRTHGRGNLPQSPGSCWVCCASRLLCCIALAAFNQFGQLRGAGHGDKLLARDTSGKVRPRRRCEVAALGRGGPGRVGCCAAVVLVWLITRSATG